MAIFVLEIGDYQYRRNIMATANVKVVAKKYIEIIHEGGFGDSSNHPYIQIFHDDQANKYPETFSKKLFSEKKLVKYLSKVARQLETGQLL